MNKLVNTMSTVRFIQFGNNYIPIENIRRVIFEKNTCEVITHAGRDFYSKSSVECETFRKALDPILVKHNENS